MYTGQIRHAYVTFQSGVWAVWHEFGKVIGLPHVSGINSLLVLSMPLSHKKTLYPLTIYADSTKRWWCIKQIYTTLSTKFNPNFHLESKVPFKVSQITDAHNLEAHFHL